MRRITPLLVAAVLVAAPATARGQAGSVAGITGVFVLDRAASDNVDKAIAAAVKDMNFVTRPIARGRLQKTNQPYGRVQLGSAGANTVVTIDGKAPRQAPANGSAIDWTREDGEKLKLSMQWDGVRLVETLKAEDGQRVNAYSLAPDGSMLLNVTITSPRLPKPLTYKLAYKRA